VNWYKRARLEMDIVEAAKRQNPGPEHQRLEAILRQIAHDSDCIELFDFPAAVGRDLVPPPGPEIAMRSADTVFLGDAKDAENETVHRDETRLRIFRYMRGLAEMFRSGKARSAAFMIATNSAEAADDWTTQLTLMAAYAGLRHVEGHVKAFQVGQHDAQTWLVF
jgi:hypothetical protein